MRMIQLEGVWGEGHGCLTSPKKIFGSVPVMKLWSEMSEESY
jgi:hypothetical protein